MTSDNPTVMIVDDEPSNLALLTQLLRPHYRVRAVTSGQRCLEAVQPPSTPDLILLDIMMPEMDGFEVLQRLRAEAATRDVPVLIVTALLDSESEERGFALGASDFITKPIRPGALLARVRAQLEAKRGRDLLREKNEQLEAEVAFRTLELEIVQTVAIRALAHLAEMRVNAGKSTNRVLRTQGYVRRLAELLAQRRPDDPALTAAKVDLYAKSAPLYDIGKVAIPDAILLKPGPLDEREWAVMKTHAERGAQALAQAEADVQVPVEFLQAAKAMARWHHERWDGKGYPDGLKGEEIPLPARLMAIADVFDALISVRPYKRAYSYDEARDLIAAGCGTQFDPQLCEQFLAHYAEFVAIAEKYPDDLTDA